VGILERFRTEWGKRYVDVFIEDEGEDGPEGEDGGVAEGEVAVEDWDGDVVEYAGED
jgi:hypothetical protein